jgi:hypothetical protein
MDRMIVYPGSIPLDTDLLNTNRNVMVAIGALAAATIGTAPVIDGLAVVPAPTGGLAVQVQPGSVAALQPVDQSAYGSLPADITDSTVKMGINTAPVTLTLSAPTTANYVTTYLIQALLEEIDSNLSVLPYYNAANPSQPFLGSANNGAAQATTRIQRVALNAKAGLAGVAGSNQVPTPDPGYVGVALVTVAAGQNTIIAADIAPFPNSRSVAIKLPDLRPGFGSATVFTSSGWFVVPPNVTSLRVTTIAGGGAGGTHSVFPGGGGGGGGCCVGWFTDIVPGSSYYATVGAGGVASTAPAAGGVGGSSGFSALLAATGGQGGGGGTVLTTPAGGAGGTPYGGTVGYAGSWGSDGVPIACLGGGGGGSGAGKGATGTAAGVPGMAFGAGGGGGGSTQPNGGGVGMPGGNGAPGLVIVEY